MSSKHEAEQAQRKITILYFASLGEKLACNEESLELDCAVLRINDLKSLLAKRQGAWKNFASDETILCAQNQDIVSTNAEIHDRDEIAFFPPVTGG